MINILLWMIGLAPIINLLIDYTTDSLMEPWKYVLSIIIGIALLTYVVISQKRNSGLR